MSTRGYLGKISAVISANNGSFVRTLNDSATRVRDFARTIQNDLKRASADASKSLNGILTPLQRIERAIQNAVSQRLSFRGFEGAIRTVRDLEKSLASLSDQEVRVVLKTTGAESIEQVKRAVSGLQQTDVDLFVNLVGAEQSLSKLQQLITQAKASGGQVLGDKVKVDIARAEQLEATLNGVGISLKRLQAAGEAVNTIRADAAATSFRALVSVAEEIGKPLAAAAQQFGTLSLEVQAQFIPALKRAQDGVKALESDIDQRLPIAERRFRGVRTEAEQAAQAIARLSEASRLVASGATGNELGFAAPRVRGELQASAQARSQVAESADPSRFRGEVQQLDRLARRIESLNASIERRRSLGLDTTEAQRKLDSVIARSSEVRESIAGANAADSVLAGQQELGRRIGNGFLNVITTAEAAADTLAAQSQELGRRIGNGFLTILTPAEAAADTIEARQQDLGRRIGNGFLNVITLAEAAADTIEAGQQELGRRIGNGFLTILTPAEAAADTIEARQQDLGRRIGNGFLNVLTQAEAAADTIQGRRQSQADALLRSGGGPGVEGLTLGIDQRQLRGLEGEIGFIQDRLSRFTDDVRGPAAAALQRYREVISNAFRTGAVSTRAGQRAIREARDEVIRLTAAIDGANPRRLGEQLRRAGDVSRAGFQNLQLVVQQAAFAVDDFFSVTGDLSQRIRAAGNNVSQLGFLLGGSIPGLTATAGLIAGISVSVGAQLVVALIKWADAGRTAEDQTKALNDALARQKSLVEELAQAFASLGDAIARRAFSGPAQEARAFRRELEEVRKKQRELREERVIGLDEGVQRARADVSVAERELGNATTRDQAVAAQRRLDEARGRLEQRESRIRGRADLTPDQTRQRTRTLFDQAALRNAQGDLRGALARALTLRTGIQRRDRVLGRLDGVDDPAQARDILREEQGRAARRGDNRLVGQLEQLINTLEQPIRRAADELAVKLIESANRAAQGIELAQNRVAAAIQAGVPGALSVAAALTRSGNEIDAAQQEIADAQRRFAESSQTPEDAAARDRRVQAARDRLERGRAGRNAAQADARELDRRRIVDPQATFESRRQRAEQNLQQAGASSGILARQIRELEARRSQLLAEADADPTNVFARRRAEQGVEAINKEITAIEAATSRLNAFSEALSRAQQEVTSDVQGGRQRADAARRRDIRLGTPETRRERQRAESEFEELQEAGQKAEEAFRLVQDRFERQARAGVGPLSADFRRRTEIDEQLQAGVDIPRAERERLEAERRSIQARIDRAVESSPEVQRARDGVARVAERQDLGRGGAELLLSSGEREARDLSENLEKLRIEFGNRAVEGTGLIDQAGLAREQRRLVEESQRRIAPLAFQFSDEIANAVLQGPSRAALGATDASTVQGQAELNRLLRGDDPAKDVNLLELQKQTDELKKLNEKLAGTAEA